MVHVRMIVLHVKIHKRDIKLMLLLQTRKGEAIIFALQNDRMRWMLVILFILKLNNNRRNVPSVIPRTTMIYSAIIKEDGAASNHDFALRDKNALINIRKNYPRTTTVLPNHISITLYLQGNLLLNDLSQKTASLAIDNTETDRFMKNQFY